MEEFSDVRFKRRAVTEFLTAEKFLPIEIHRRVQAVYGDQCVDMSTVRRWVRWLKDGELGQADLRDKTQSYIKLHSFHHHILTYFNITGKDFLSEAASLCDISVFKVFTP